VIVRLAADGHAVVAARRAAARGSSDGARVRIALWRVADHLEVTMTRDTFALWRDAR